MLLIAYLQEHCKLPKKAIENTVALLEKDCTVPFISRYRKEATGGLDEVAIENILGFKTQYEALEKRRVAILKAIEAQAMLTPELHDKLRNAQDLIQLEDLYLPFKKSKRTKAEVARKNGLELGQNHHGPTGGKPPIHSTYLC